MASNSKGSFSGSYLKLFSLIGFCIGGILFILERVGVDIPVVIGTTSYHGVTAGFILFFGALFIMFLLGLLISIIRRRT